MMKYGLVLLTLLMNMAGAAFADGGPPGIGWKGWSVSSTEAFDLESGVVPKFPMRYPLTNLFDGDPSTTWAFEDGLGRSIKQKQEKSAAENRPCLKKLPRPVPPVWSYGSRQRHTCQQDFSEERHPSLQIRPHQAVVMDSLWLMNGYTRRPDLYRRNDRAMSVRISINGSKIKDVALSDTIGWHKISLPRQAVDSLEIAFTNIRKGEGPDNDLCVSELAFFDRGRRVAMKMPQAVVFGLSGCCGGTGYCMARSGRVIAEGAEFEETGVIWNPAGNLVAGVDSGSVKPRLWIADATRARVRRTFPLLQAFTDGIAGMKWKDNRTLVIEQYDARRKRNRQRLFRV